MTGNGWSGWVNLTPEWRAGIQDVLRRASGGGPDFRWMHAGDSIATGTIGIGSVTEHYVARASALAARHWGITARRGLHTSGPSYSGGRVRVSGRTARSDEPGALFGARSWLLPAGGDGELRFTPSGTADTICIAHTGGGFRYRLEGDWVPVLATDAAPARLRVDTLEAGTSIRVAATAEADARIHGFESADAAHPSITWQTTGIGGARIADLHTALAAKGEAGYASYGALAPDLLTIGIGVNDTIHADVESIARSARSMRSVVDRMLAHGVDRIVLVGPNPVREDFQPGPWFVRDAYERVLRPVADEFGLPLLDVTVGWGDYDPAHAAGYLADQVHPTAKGHRSIAAALATLLVPDEVR